ncbi:FAD-binding oxidoreductase [Mesorhizobium sp. BAC0120]|uniref:FAD-binding oxidoreductase n=1 Tax=Mesorhizobium sp. BAC0120 TaxID=3090670 RepID=UPI00298CE6B2|nr:FAD-binding oxidoreductase [Mesorhizobium sp. BAC0120]MDW6023254.1 FAD-binding oxidoreductase [Mesorhizobium sp. BAC0120]
MDAVAELLAALGPEVCLTGPALDGIAVRSDASATGRDLPIALLRPSSVAEVSTALTICHRHHQPVVPQGGMTGLAGGANCRPGDVALSLARFQGVEEIDPIAAAMVVRAGTVLETAQNAALDADLLLPIDLGARGSCQIGGNIATNAGGLRVIRHGTVRDNLLGLEAVQADGTVLSHLSRMQKDNTGYDLRHLLAGSEGTLAVITRAVLRLRPLPSDIETAVCAVESYDAVLALLRMARGQLTLSAFEVMWADYFDLCGGSRLFAETPPFAVIVETEGSGLENLLEKAIGEGVIFDALIAQSEAEARRFWEVREAALPEAHMDDIVNLDVSLPIASIDDYVRSCRAAIASALPSTRSFFFGHVGDSNLHIMVQVPGYRDADVHAVDRIAYGLVREVGGMISAEHGIGTLKLAWLGHSRCPGELDAMRAIKHALDPAGILNPGKVI